MTRIDEHQHATEVQVRAHFWTFAQVSETLWKTFTRQRSRTAGGPSFDPNSAHHKRQIRGLFALFGTAVKGPLEWPRPHRTSIRVQHRLPLFPLGRKYTKPARHVTECVLELMG